MCGESRAAWRRIGRDVWCRDCWNQIRVKKGKPKLKPVRIRQKSSKREKLDAIYSIMRRKFLSDYTLCHAKVDVRCLLRSSEVHHKAGRISELYLDIRFWCPVCRFCHRFLEENPIVAKELGLSIERLSK